MGSAARCDATRAALPLYATPTLFYFLFHLSDFSLLCSCIDPFIDGNSGAAFWVISLTLHAWGNDVEAFASSHEKDPAKLPKGVWQIQGASGAYVHAANLSVTCTVSPPPPPPPLDNSLLLATAGSGAAAAALTAEIGLSSDKIELLTFCLILMLVTMIMMAIAAVMCRRAGGCGGAQQGGLGIRRVDKAKEAARKEERSRLSSSTSGVELQDTESRAASIRPMGFS